MHSICSILDYIWFYLVIKIRRNSTFSEALAKAHTGLCSHSWPITGKHMCFHSHIYIRQMYSRVLKGLILLIHTSCISINERSLNHYHHNSIQLIYSICCTLEITSHTHYNRVSPHAMTVHLRTAVAKWLVDGWLGSAAH